jgi:hypothetical protein
MGRDMSQTNGSERSGLSMNAESPARGNSTPVRFIDLLLDLALRCHFANGSFARQAQDLLADNRASMTGELLSLPCNVPP